MSKVEIEKKKLTKKGKKKLTWVNLWLEISNPNVEK